MQLLRTYLPFFIGLATGLYYIGLNITGHSFEFFPGDLIDARFNTYLLEHCHKFFSGQVKDFWNAPFMFPENDVISYSDNLLGTAPFYSIFRIFGNDRETAFQLWFLLMMVFNYSTTYLLLNYLFNNKYAAVLGAMVFAFSIALQSQVGHAQTYSRFPIPLAFWMALIFVKEFKPLYFFLAVFTWVYQMYCGIYLGFMLFIPLLTFFVVSIGQNKKLALECLKNRKWFFQMLGICAANLVMLLPLMIPYFERAKDMGLYDFAHIRESLPTMASYFFSWNGSVFWDSLKETCIEYPAFWDHQLFAGGIATCCVLIFIVINVLHFFRPSATFKFQPAKPIQLIFIALFVTAIIFMRFGNFSLYRLIFIIPGYGSMRALQRIINIELLLFAIATAFIFAKVFSSKNVFSSFVFLVLVVFIVADNYVKEGFIHQMLKAHSQSRINVLVEKMKIIPEENIVSYEPDTLLSNSSGYQLDAMLASQSLGIKTLNGYSATSPAGYDAYWRKPNEESRKIWLEKKGITKQNIVVIR